MNPTVSLLISILVGIAVPLAAVVIVERFDIFGSASRRNILISLVYGATAAFLGAYVLNTLTVQLLESAGMPAPQAYNVVVRLTAPILEELLKSLVLIWLIRQPSFKYAVDGAIYGFAVGIGFAVAENLLYISNNPNAALGLTISRVLSTTMMHASVSAVVGFMLGSLRRATRGQRALPIAGILIAVSVHILYNNLVQTLSGAGLLLVAIVIGLGSASAIVWLMNRDLAREKETMREALNEGATGVSEGEAMAIQRMGGASLEDTLKTLGGQIGDENVGLIRRLLVTQANIGILRNNLASANVSPRLRAAWEQEITERQQEFQEIRGELNRSALDYMQKMFPSDDATLQTWAADELAKGDSAGLHLFDMFMRSSGLSENLTADQLVDRAERLHRIDFFSGVDLADLENLSRGIAVASFDDHERLFEQGDAGDAMYLVDEGQLAIYTVDDQGREQRLRTFQPGAVVGEIAVLDGGPRTATARASGPLTALVLRREMFRMYVQSRPQVTLAVLRQLVEKGRFTTSTVEQSIQQVSDISRGHYQEAARAAESRAVTAAAAGAAGSELSPEVALKLNSALAGYARALAERGSGAASGQTP
jgi:RsiW-degrading membrane proteinase PrsW (M82 family)/CRP-like cAMP-binding protein